MNSVPCSPERREQCPVFRAEGECYEDVHHEYWPKNRYRTPVEKRFVNLAINQTIMCRDLHNEEHTKRPPEKPSRDQMLQAIQMAVSTQVSIGNV